MGENQAIIVPQISSLPGNEAQAARLLRWLAQREIVQAYVSTCGRSGNRMAFAIAAGARRVVERPELLPFGRPINGLELVTKRCIYTPTQGFREEAGCPECRQEIGPPLFDSLERWWPGETDNFVCPECGFEDDINGFLFLQPCGFSDLGLVFNNWAQASFRQTFLDELAERIGFAVRLVVVEDPA